MSTANKKIVHKEALKKLKKIGVLPDLDARKKLDAKQKRKIRDAWNKYEKVATAPTGSIQKISTKNLSATQIWELQRSGYKTVKAKQTVFIPKFSHDTAKIKQSKYGLTIERKKLGAEIQTEFVISDRAKMLSMRDRLMSDYMRGKFGANDYIGLRLFENNRFKSVIYQSMTDIYKYIEDDFTPDVRYATREYLVDNIKLVKISARRLSDISQAELTQREKNRIKRERTKKSAGIYIKKPQKKSSGNVVSTTRKNHGKKK